MRFCRSHWIVTLRVFLPIPLSEAFPCGKIPFEGPKSRNPLSFKTYDGKELIEGKPMREHLRFAAAYWHCMRNPLGDPFGEGTALTPWEDRSPSVDNALRRADVFFEFLGKIGIEYYCFHDPRHRARASLAARNRGGARPGGRAFETASIANRPQASLGHGLPSSRIRAMRRARRPRRTSKSLPMRPRR